MSGPMGDRHWPSLSRRGFVALGGVGLAAMIVGCGDDDDAATGGSGSFDGSVVVVGAGPAGMTAAHRLLRRGVDVTVLEALPFHGGRIRHDLDFTDFPISLGGEWLHVEPGVLGEIVDDPAVATTTPLRAYEPTDTAGYFDGELLVAELGPYSDLKFVGSSWLGFFDTHVMPSVGPTIRYDTPVVAVDHSSSPVRLTDAGGTVHEADHAIVTVPLKILQRGDITFTPPLPQRHADAIAEATVWSGLKAFLHFSEPFFPTFLAFPDSETAEGQRVYYDAAYGQETDDAILGLFSVGAQAERYQALDDDALLAAILAELDEVFDGAASRTYLRHIVQNWNDEPFAGAAYLEDGADEDISRALSAPVSDRLTLAGDAATSFDDWSSVHTAARSAIEAVDRLLAATSG